jgi:16S rRNA (guanine527-N7)-methyltransferase
MSAKRPEAGPLTPEGFAGLVPVSRETLECLTAYLDLLRRWQRTINLVGAGTLDDPWRRHILDSAQLARFLPEGARRLVDLGSGAGLPGLVLAIMGVPDVHLIESDRRKAAFLREAARATGAAASVHACRIEAAPPLEADIITARALAPLAQLLPLAARFATPASRCLFLKGRQAETELTEAARGWTMEVQRQPSLSDAEGCVLIISGLQRVGSE